MDLSDIFYNLKFGPIFRNELLVALNNVNRNSGKIAGGEGRVVEIARDGVLRYVKYHVASILNFIVLFLSPRLEKAEEIFFFINMRNIAFNSKAFSSYRVGLFNFRYFKYPHLYSVLDKSTMISCVVLAFKLYPKFKCDLKELYEELNIDAAVGGSFIHPSLLRLIDIHLFVASLIGRCGVSTSGHFDVYTSAASVMREMNALDGYVGNQHGLFEFFHYGESNKLYFDEIYLLSCLSEKYFLEKMNANSKLKIRHIKRGVRFTEELQKGSEKVIVFGFQNDSILQDVEIVNLFIAGLASHRLRMIVYVHPQTTERTLRFVKEHLPAVEVEKAKRYVNVDLVVTRYSTIGLDYVESGVSALFITEHDNVCLSQSENKYVHTANTKAGAVSLAEGILW